MIHFINIFLITIGIIVLILYLKKKTKIFIESTNTDPRKIHEKDITRIGGLVFVSLIYFFLSNYFGELNLLELDIKTFLIYAYIIFFIGFIEDITNALSYKIRFFLLIVPIFLFVISNSLYIYDFDHKIIDPIINSSIYLSLFFSVLSIFLVVNGFNIIDGLNGLSLGIAAIILFNISILSFNLNSFIFTLSASLLIPTILLFIINFYYGEVLLGDGGSYFLGFTISVLCIVSSQYNILNSFHIACIIFYPAFEIFFTFLRRITIDKSSPFLPDDMHLHFMLFNIMKKIPILKNYSNTFNNSASALVIIILFASINLIMLIYREVINFSLFFVFLVLLYLVMYYFIKKLFAQIVK